MIKHWLVGLFIAALLGGKAFADCVPSPDTPGLSSNIFKNSISRYQNSSASRKTPPLKPRRSPSRSSPS